MSKFIKVSLIVIGSCILAGAILFGIGFNLCGGVIDFRYDLNRRELVSKGEKYVLELTELDDFKDIEADLSIGDLKFIKSDKFAIEYEYYDVEPEFSVDNGKLTVKTADQFFDLSFDFSVSNKSYMKIYYPDGAEFNDLSVDLSCGNLNIDGMNVSGKSVFDNSCGNVTVNNYTAKDVEIDLSSGNFSSDTMTVDTIISDNSCGDIIFNNLTCNTSFESINSCGLISVNDSVLNGKVTRTAEIRVIRDGIVVAEDKIDSLLDEWSQTLYNTLSDPLLGEQMTYLKPQQRTVIDQFLKTQQLPEKIDNYFIDAVTALLEGFEPVAISADEFIDKLDALGPCDIDTFKTKINDLLKDYTKGKDAEKLRIVVKR